MLVGVDVYIVTSTVAWHCPVSLEKTHSVRALMLVLVNITNSLQIRDFKQRYQSAIFELNHKNLSRIAMLLTAIKTNANFKNSHSFPDL